MPTPTYIPLATVTLGAAASSVSFSSIPATFRDLVLVADGRFSDTFARAAGLRFNADSSSSYSRVLGFAVGSSAPTGFAETGTSIEFVFGGTISPFIEILQIADYSATDKHKIVLQRDSQPGRVVSMQAGRYASTNAITSLVINTLNNFASGSTFSLYGIAS